MTPRRLLGLWGPVCLQAALLFYLSSLRGTFLPPRGWDKVAHFAAYAILATLSIRALHGGFVPLRLRPTLLAILLTALYGASDEVHQLFVPGREASVADLVADVSGALFATIVLAVVAGVAGAPGGERQGDPEGATPPPPS